MSMAEIEHMWVSAYLIARNISTTNIGNRKIIAMRICRKDRLLGEEDRCIEHNAACVAANAFIKTFVKESGIRVDY